jgi:hypothetical protein
MIEIAFWLGLAVTTVALLWAAWPYIYPQSNKDDPLDEFQRQFDAVLRDLEEQEQRAVNAISKTISPKKAVTKKSNVTKFPVRKKVAVKRSKKK